MPEDHTSSENNPGGGGRHQGPLQKIRALLSQRPDSGGRATVTEDHVLSILASRRGRERTFGRDLFADPAWDVLLELYAARLGRRRMGLQELAKSIDMPESTISRWITALAQRRWVIASDSEGSIELSPEAEREMNRVIGYWGTAFRSI